MIRFGRESRFLLVGVCLAGLVAWSFFGQCAALFLRESRLAAVFGGSASFGDVVSSELPLFGLWIAAGVASAAAFGAALLNSREDARLGAAASAAARAAEESCARAEACLGARGVSSPDPRETLAALREANARAELGAENALLFFRVRECRAAARARRFSVERLAECVSRRAFARLAASGIDSELDVAPDLRGAEAETSPGFIELIALNFADVASRGASDGLFRVSLRREGGALRFDFSDEDGGLFAEARARFVASDSRLPDAEAEIPELGFAAARAFARELGGSLELEEESAGAGVAFSLRLPCLVR